MANGTKKFTADKDKTVTITGVTYNVTFDTIPGGVSISLNDTPVVAGTPVNITADFTGTIAIEYPEITINYSGTLEPVITDTVGG